MFLFTFWHPDRLLKNAKSKLNGSERHQFNIKFYFRHHYWLPELLFVSIGAQITSMASFYRLQSFVYSAFNVFCFHSRSLWPDIIEDQLALPSLTAKKVFCFFWFKMCVMCVFNILKVDKLRIYKSLKTYNIENPKRVKINSVFRL